MCQAAQADLHTLCCRAGVLPGPVLLLLSLHWDQDMTDQPIDPNPTEPPAPPHPEIFLSKMRI